MEENKNIKYYSVFARGFNTETLAREWIDVRGKNTSMDCQFICYKNTQTSTHYRRKTANRPSAHPLPASPTALLNVRKLCSGECGGKGQPMVMPQLTLCFTAQSRRR